MSDVYKKNLYKALGITCGVMICMFLFIPFFGRLSSQFIIPTHFNINVNPDGTFDRYPPLIDRNSYIIASVYGLSGLVMSFIVMLLAKSNQIRNVFYASFIIIFFNIISLYSFNKQKSKDPATEALESIKSGYDSQISYSSGSLARNIYAKQIQAQEILNSAFLFIFALFGAWLLKNIYFSKKAQSKVNTVEIT